MLKSVITFSLVIFLIASALQAEPVLINGSFTADSHPGDGVSLGNEFEITGWTRDSEAAIGQAVHGQFHYDNGLGDGQVVWIQNNQVISQSIDGFEEGKTYKIMVWANARAATDPPYIQIRFNGVAIAGTETPLEVTPVEAVGSFSTPFHQYSDTVSPGEGSFTLAIEQTNGTPDRTLLVDTVAVYEVGSGPVVLNGGFEENNPDGGGVAYGGFDLLGAWLPNDFSSMGNIGNDVLGVAYYDNGWNTEGIQVAYLQDGNRSISQSVDGFEAGKTYTLSFAANARNGNVPELKVTLDDQILFQEVIPWVDMFGWHTLDFNTYTVNFTSPGDGAYMLSFTQLTSGDQSVLLDDVKISEYRIPSSVNTWTLY